MRSLWWVVAAVVLCSAVVAVLAAGSPVDATSTSVSSSKRLLAAAENNDDVEQPDAGNDQETGGPKEQLSAVEVKTAALLLHQGLADEQGEEEEKPRGAVAKVTAEIQPARVSGEAPEQPVSVQQGEEAELPLDQDAPHFSARPTSPIDMNAFVAVPTDKTQNPTLTDELGKQEATGQDQLAEEIPEKPDEDKEEFQFKPLATESYTLSVVVITTRDSIFLKNCLRSLYDALLHSQTQDHKSHIPPPVIEVVVAVTQAVRLAPALSVVNIISKKYPTLPMPVALSEIPLTVASAMNIGASQTRGSNILFLQDLVEVPEDFFSSLHSFMTSGKYEEDKTVAFGFKLLGSDMESIYHIGVEYLIGKFGRTYRYYYGGSEEYLSKNVPLPLYTLQGYYHAHPFASTQRIVDSLGPECLVFPRSAFTTLGVLNTTFSDLYSMADICFRGSTTTDRRCFYYPHVSAIFYGNEGLERETEGFESASKTFLRRWYPYLKNKTFSEYRHTNLTLIWNMECGSGATLGFTTEALNAVMHLRNKISLKIELSNKYTCKEELLKAGWPMSVRDVVQILAAKEIDYPTNSVLVLHRDPGRYWTFLSERWGESSPAHVVGRSMFETDTIPSDWVAPCNNAVQEIWVPSEFNVGTFKQAGVTVNVTKVPNSINTDVFYPGIYEPYPLPNRTEFAFLAVMKWEERKGWDMLLHAYMEEFAANEPVSLYIRSALDSKDLLDLEAFVYTVTKEKLSGPNGYQGVPQAPIILDTVLPYPKTPSLYVAADCFVLPSHGEGWGLPLIEAMAMGLPTIATNWSGNTEFMKQEFSFLISVEDLVNSTIPGHKWALPSESHLRSLMRYVFENKEEARAKAAAARPYIVENYSQEPVTNIILQKAEELGQYPRYSATPPRQTTTTTTTTTSTNTNSRWNYNSAYRSGGAAVPPTTTAPKKGLATRIKIN
ncbi:glycosyltransferase, CAZy family GT4 [Pelomyxa schiedti]|nr:glycosyltransferase, CAZy family GT4 [Pelomyxa schiedti]